MTRVSEGSNKASLNFSLNKVKKRLEDLQLKGTTLNKISRPSDNAISNIEALAITSLNEDNKQFQRNADYALLTLGITEKAISGLTDILSKAKELAISQSSDFYDHEIRKNVAAEVRQLHKEAISIANKRVGTKYVFSGFKTLQRPFTDEGKYLGDKNHISVEISKDFFVPINLHGEEVFFTEDKTDLKEMAPHKSKDIIKQPQNKENDKINANRELASVEETDQKNSFESRNNIISMLETFATSLENNDPSFIQNLLERFDKSIQRLITLRTKIGSLTNSVQSAKIMLEDDTIDNKTRRSKLVDVDVAELFSDLTRQQNVLQTTYQSANGVINKSLLDFIR